MPKLNNLEKGIPALYRRSALSMLMFGYVQGVRATLHTVTVKAAIRMFMTHYGLTDDNYNADSALTTFN